MLLRAPNIQLLRGNGTLQIWPSWDYLSLSYKYLDDGHFPFLLLVLSQVYLNPTSSTSQFWLLFFFLCTLIYNILMFASSRNLPGEVIYDPPRLLVPDRCQICGRSRPCHCSGTFHPPTRSTWGKQKIIKWIWVKNGWFRGTPIKDHHYYHDHYYHYHPYHYIIMGYNGIITVIIVIWLWVKHLFWLVVLTILKTISQWEGLSHILWKIKHVWNHQPAIDKCQKHPKTMMVNVGWDYHRLRPSSGLQRVAHLLWVWVI